MAMSRRRKIIIIISGIVIVLALAVFIVLAILISAIRGGEPSIPDNSVLVLKVQGELVDYTPDDPLRRLFGSDDSSLSNLLLQIKKAKVD